MREQRLGGGRRGGGVGGGVGGRRRGRRGGGAAAGAAAGASFGAYASWAMNSTETLPPRPLKVVYSWAGAAPRSMSARMHASARASAKRSITV